MKLKLHYFAIQNRYSLAGVGKNDDGPLIMFILEVLDEVNQVGIFHLLWCEDVPLVQLLHSPNPDKECQTEFNHVAPEKGNLIILQ